MYRPSFINPPETKGPLCLRVSLYFLAFLNHHNHSLFSSIFISPIFVYLILQNRARVIVHWGRAFDFHMASLISGIQYGLLRGTDDQDSQE